MYHFWVFGMTQPGIEPRSRGPLANTLTTIPMSGIEHIYNASENIIISTKKSLLFKIIVNFINIVPLKTLRLQLSDYFYNWRP